MKTKKSIEELIKYEAKQFNTKIVLSANETKNYLFEDGYTFKNNFSKYTEVNGDTLRKALAKKYDIAKDNVILGNGSTELLELTVKTYCENDDVILSFDPSFSMYDVYAKVYGANLIKVPTDDSFIQSIDLMIEYIDKYNPKMMFVCNPNNPTGNLVKRNDIIKLLNYTDALVVVDEAYMEFTDETESVVDLINYYDNLIVARTFSKAYGMASARLGYMLGNTDLLTDLMKVKLPYNVNSFTLTLGVEAVYREKDMKAFVKSVISQREYLVYKLSTLDITVYETYGNFLFVQSKKELFSELLDKDILIRSFGEGYYRITIGTKEENKELVKALKEVLQWEKVQNQELQRKQT